MATVARDRAGTSRSLGDLARSAKTYPFQDLPLLLVAVYLGLIFTFFLIWPINWPIFGAWNWLALIGYVACCFGAIALGYTAGRKRRKGPQVIMPFAWARFFIAAGALSAVAMLTPLSFTYAGQGPWMVLSALQQQGEVYSQLQMRLIETAGQRGPIAFARMVLGPLTFAVVPLGILYWRRIGNVLRAGVIAAASCSVILSIMRGTDRELADLFLVSAAAFLVSLGRLDAGSARVFAIIRRYLFQGLLLVLLVWVAAGLFTDRRTARLGGFENRAVVCANQSQICADIDAPAIRWLPLEQRFSVSLYVLSSASGFYGLYLGLEQPWRPTLGVGHSPAALAVYETLTGDESMRLRTYTFRNTFQGWSDENFWSTLILWLANDLSFPGAVVALGLIGFIWGRAWRDATQGGSDPAAIIFCQMMVVMAYLPANNQVFAVYEGYSIFFVWVVLWLRQRKVRIDRPMQAA